MQKLLMAAAAAGALTMLALAPAQAEKSPFCKFAGAQKNQVSWNAYYHCIEAPKAMRTSARVHARATRAEAKSPYCKMASAQKNIVAWNAYYHCLGR